MEGAFKIRARELGYGFALVLASPFYKKQWATLKNKWLCKADLKIAKLS